jgi:hypothetical protein
MISLIETTARDLASSDVIGRGAGSLLCGLPDHPTPKYIGVAWSTGLAKLRDNDLIVLSVLTREERGMMSTKLVLVT